MILWTIRHTKPYNPNDVCYGRLDFDVSDTFPEESSSAIADFLKAGPKPSRLFSSPLLRCLRLAEKVSEATGLPIEKEDRIIELNFGSWEGQKLTAAPRAEMAAWMKDWRGFRFPQGESFHDVDRRVEEFLDSLDDDEEDECRHHIERNGRCRPHQQYRIHPTRYRGSPLLVLLK